jgi:hypothetical protein
MSPIVYRIVEVLCALVESLPVGTNLGLLHVLWALVSGRLLAQRGAVIPALWASGLCRASVLRAWRALAHGRWQCTELVGALQQWIAKEQMWQAHEHEGCRPVACDLTAFFRPALRNCGTRHYSNNAKRMLAALPFGLLVRVGSVGTKRIPLLAAIVRAEPEQREETELMRRLLQEAVAQLAPHEVLVGDRGFGIALVQQAGVKRFVVRCARNAVAYRQAPPAYAGRGRKPKWGAFVHPLPGRRKGQTLPATPPDAIESWDEPHGRIQAQLWEGLTVKGAPADAPAVRMAAISDPRYREPLLLATTLPVSARSLRDLYVDRWPVEMVPQTAKQMLGAQRQFVFGAEARWRLPELSLLAACVALYLAATLPASPTGFWDRTPRPTVGRLRRLLAATLFSESWPLPAKLRKKNAMTAHLPKGVTTHRRQPSGHKRPNQLTPRRSKPKVTRN